VVKVMDYSKFKYEQAIKAKEARRKQSLVVLKEMKMRPKIDPHDYETKKGHVERFLKQGHKVKVTIMFRGREMAHTELGRRLLERLATDIVDIAQVDSPARQDGRNMIAVFSPRKTAQSGPGRGRGGGERDAASGRPQGTHGTPGRQRAGAEPSAGTGTGTGNGGRGPAQPGGPADGTRGTGTSSQARPGASGGPGTGPQVRPAGSGGPGTGSPVRPGPAPTSAS
jgi:translation initiation factor IF-3